MADVSLVRITRTGYTHSGRSFPVGSVLRVSANTAKAILDYEVPAWGVKTTAAEAKEAGAQVVDLVNLEPANADAAAHEAAAKK